LRRAVSAWTIRRIAALEANLRVLLFERSPAGYKITEAGQRLAAEVQQMESAVVRIQTDLSAEVNSLAGPVRLTMPEGFSSIFLCAGWMCSCASIPTFGSS
jgi:DNA-binding transcriptional LysR family regulator